MAQVKLYKFDSANKAFAPHSSATDDLTVKSLDVASPTDTIGGVQKQNIADKSLAQTISGLWTFGANVNASGGATLTGFSALNVANNTDQIGGIQRQNLLDKTQGATISGAWMYNNSIDVPQGNGFKIGGSGAHANFTAANFNKLLDGSDCDALHSHAGLDSTITLTAGAGGVAGGDCLYLSGNDTVLKADNTLIAKSRVIGFAKGPISASAQGEVIARPGDRIGPTPMLANAAAGSPVYLGTGGGITTNVPTGGNYKVLLGYVLEADATDGTFLFGGISEPVLM